MSRSRSRGRTERRRRRSDSRSSSRDRHKYRRRSRSRSADYRPSKAKKGHHHRHRSNSSSPRRRRSSSGDRGRGRSEDRRRGRRSDSRERSRGRSHVARKAGGSTRDSPPPSPPRESAKVTSDHSASPIVVPKVQYPDSDEDSVTAYLDENFGGAAMDVDIDEHTSFTAPVVAGIIKKALENGHIRLRQDCMCPVSYETISNLPGEEYRHFRESLIDQSNKQNDTVICHGQTKGFKEMKFLLSHCTSIKGCVIHETIANYMVDHNIVQRQVKVDTAVLKQECAQRDKQIVWPAIVRLTGLLKKFSKQDAIRAIMGHVNKVMAAHNHHGFTGEALVIFEQTVEGFDMANSVVARQDQQEDYRTAELCTDEQLRDYVNCKKTDAFKSIRGRWKVVSHKDYVEVQKEKKMKQATELQSANKELQSKVEDLRRENEETSKRLRDDAEALAQKEAELEAQRQQLAEARQKHDDDMRKMEQKKREEAELQEKERREADYKEQTAKATTEDQLKEIQKRYEQESRRKEELQKMLKSNHDDFQQRRAEMEAKLQEAELRIQKETEEKRRILREKLEVEKAKRDELAKMRVENAPADVIAALNKEVKAAQDDAAYHEEQFNRIAHEGIGMKTKLNETKEALQGFMWRLAGGDPDGLYAAGMYRALVEKHKPPELMRTVWANQDEILERLMMAESKGESKAGKSKSLKARAAEIYEWLDDVLRKHEPPPRELKKKEEKRTDYFSPFVIRNAQIMGRNLNDPHMQKAEKKYGPLIQDYLFEIAKEVHHYNPSGHYPVNIFWDHEKKAELEVNQLAKKLLEYVETALMDYDSDLRSPSSATEHGKPVVDVTGS